MAPLSKLALVLAAHMQWPSQGAVPVQRFSRFSPRDTSPHGLSSRDILPSSPSVQPRDVQSPPVMHATCTAGTKIPNLWSVADLVVSYTEDETIRHGNASFTLTNAQTHVSQSLRCSLRFNYLCEFTGTPLDKDVRVWLQINLMAAAVVISQPWACDNDKGAQVTGTADVSLTCPEERGETLSCGSSAGEVSWTDGSVVLVDQETAAIPKVMRTANPVEDTSASSSANSGAGKGLMKREVEEVIQREVEIESGEMEGKVVKRRWRKGSTIHGRVMKRGVLGVSSRVDHRVQDKWTGHGENKRSKKEVKKDVENNIQENTKNPSNPPYPIPDKQEEVGMDKLGVPTPNRIMGMARRGRAMAHALAHYDVRHREPEKAVDGDDESQSARNDETQKQQESQKKVGGDNKKEQEDEVMTEKKLIDQLEHRLCSPSCLKEAIPGPESGRQWTNGRRTNPVMPPGHGVVEV